VSACVKFPTQNYGRIRTIFHLQELTQKFFIFNSLKSDGLKLPQLLSQFLYQNRKLDLPGIGSFTLDPEAVIPQESDRIGQIPATGIHFKNANIALADDALISFIKEHTGKMKSLAASDLDFHLTTGRQLLNIGKPFYLEGIGTLLKNKEGLLDFTPGEYMVARLENAGPESKSSFDEPPRVREARNNSTRQGLLLLMIFIGLVIIGWGGYYLYKRNNFTEPAAEKQAVVVPDTAEKKDTASGAGRNITDTGAASKTVAAPVSSGSANPPAVPAPVPTATTQPGATPVTTAANLPVPPGARLYHFVILATDDKHRAVRRYNQLLGYKLNVRMYQKDSAWFKLYFPIAAFSRDTAYIKDSLSNTYAAPHVIIEQH
jgi:hypothetical protein